MVTQLYSRCCKLKAELLAVLYQIDVNEWKNQK